MTRWLPNFVRDEKRLTVYRCRLLTSRHGASSAHDCYGIRCSHWSGQGSAPRKRAFNRVDLGGGTIDGDGLQTRLAADRQLESRLLDARDRTLRRRGRRGWSNPDAFWTGPAGTLLSSGSC